MAADTIESIVSKEIRTEKVGLGITPIAKLTTGVAESSFTENAGGTVVNVDSTADGYTFQQVVKALRLLGLLT